MNFEEHAAKPLLQAAGIAIPRGQLGAERFARPRLLRAALGVPVVVKAQVPTGKRGKAGGIRSADDPAAAHEAANGRSSAWISRGTASSSVLVEERAAVADGVLRGGPERRGVEGAAGGVLA